MAQAQRVPQPNNYLLLIESDRDVQANNQQILAPRGLTVRIAFTLAEARTALGQAMPAAIVMEIQLADGNGLNFLRHLRKTSHVPVLILSNLSDPDDIVCGLEAGADDYLVKPQIPRIFLARIATLLRRASRMPEVLICGSIQVNTLSNKAYCHGQDLNLGQKELLLLQLFIQHPNQKLSADFLYEKVWGQKMMGMESTLKVSISKLRSKLIEADAGYSIFASRREGYTFEQA